MVMGSYYKHGSKGGWQVVAVSPFAPEEPVSLKVDYPATVYIGRDYPATVTVYDRLGRVVEEYEGPVTFTSTDAYAAYEPQVVHLTRDDYGLKAVTVTFNSLGEQTLTADATSLTGHAHTQVVDDPVRRPKLNLRMRQVDCTTLPNGVAYRLEVQNLDTAEVSLNDLKFRMWFKESTSGLALSVGSAGEVKDSTGTSVHTTENLTGEVAVSTDCTTAEGRQLNWRAMFTSSDTFGIPPGGLWSGIAVTVLNAG